eukprot:7391544-Prymnesium_polylepis.3
MSLFGTSWTTTRTATWYLRIRKSLYKIAHDDGTFHRAIVFEAARDIAEGEWLSFTYEEPDPAWGLALLA